MGWNVSVWYCCTAHYVIVDQWNRSLLNLLKKSSRTEVVRTLSDIVVPHVERWQLSGSVYVFLIVMSYTLIYTHAQLTDCEASRKAYGLSSFARYNVCYVPCVTFVFSTSTSSRFEHFCSSSASLLQGSSHSSSWVVSAALFLIIVYFGANLGYW